MDDLVVDNKLATTVVDDESANAATALVEGIADPLEEVALVDDRQTLLDITRLGHGNDVSIIADVQDTVGLVDRAEHGLDHHGGRRVGHEARLLMELAGEEVHTHITVLASLGGDGDTDHLARTTLQDQEVANADKVAGDRDSVRRVTTTWLHDADILAHSTTNTGGAAFTGEDDLLLVMVVVERVQDAAGSTLDSAAERVVVTFVVVVPHLACGAFFERLSPGGVDLDGSSVMRLGRLDYFASERVARVRFNGRPVRSAGRDVDLVARLDAATIFTLSDIKLAF